jgi:hypothetical protein
VQEPVGIWAAAGPVPAPVPNAPPPRVRAAEQMDMNA